MKEQGWFSRKRHLICLSSSILSQDSIFQSFISILACSWWWWWLWLDFDGHVDGHGYGWILMVMVMAWFWWWWWYWWLWLDFGHRYRLVQLDLFGIYDNVLMFREAFQGEKHISEQIFVYWKKMVDSVVKDTNLYFELHFQDIKYFKYFFLFQHGDFMRGLWLYQYMEDWVWSFFS